MTIPETAPAETGLIPSIPIDRLLVQRDAARKALERILAAVQDYQRIGEALQLTTGAEHKFHGPLTQDAYGRSHHPADDAWLARSTKTLDASLWALLLDKSGLRTFMDAKARERWDEQIDKLQTPELTAENIRSTFRNLYDSRADMFGADVVNLFSELSWNYRTNQPVKFGKRLIITYVRAGTASRVTAPATRSTISCGRSASSTRSLRRITDAAPTRS